MEEPAKVKGNNGPYSDLRVPGFNPLAARGIAGVSHPRTKQPAMRMNETGYSMLQMLITLTVGVIVAAFAFLGIVSARASLRLSGSAREFAVLVERARTDAVKRHDTTTIAQVDASNYSVTMDFTGNGTVTTQTFSVKSGVSVNFPRTIVFDWRGRIPVETSIGFTNESGSSNVDITGSGDITIDAQIFHDGSIPPTTLSGPGGSVIPDPTPTGGDPSTP